MKIAVYHNSPMGGALRALEEQVTRLSAKHSVHCFTLSSSPQEGHWLDSHVADSTVFSYHLGDPSKMNIIDWWHAFRNMKNIQIEIAREINLHHFDVCLTNTCMYYEIPSLQKYLNIPIVYYAHSVSTPLLDREKKRLSLNPLGYWLVHAISNEKQSAIHAADTVVTNSEFMKSLLMNIFNVDSVVNHLGVDTEAFYPEADVIRGNYVLGVGALSSHKAHDFSINSLSLIPEQYRPELWIAYPNEVPGVKDYLIRLASDNGIKLKLIEKADTTTLRSLYCNALATLYPSSNEPLGLVPPESMSCGTPVIGVAEGGIKETIIDGVTGYLIDRNTKQCADVVMSLINNPKQIHNMGIAGREYALKEWNWQLSVDGLEKILTVTAANREVTDDA
ncbi:MAG: glycosyltransferase family 4 protein [Armatimonadota bacterium]